MLTNFNLAFVLVERGWANHIHPSFKVFNSDIIKLQISFTWWDKSATPTHPPKIPKLEPLMNGLSESSFFQSGKNCEKVWFIFLNSKFFPMRQPYLLIFFLSCRHVLWCCTHSLPNTLSSCYLIFPCCLNYFQSDGVQGHIKALPSLNISGCESCDSCSWCSCCDDGFHQHARLYGWHHKHKHSKTLKTWQSCSWGKKQTKKNISKKQSDKDINTQFLLYNCQNDGDDVMIT